MDIMLHDGKWYRNLELLADDEVDKYCCAERDILVGDDPKVSSIVGFLIHVEESSDDSSRQLMLCYQTDIRAVRMTAPEKLLKFLKSV